SMKAARWPLARNSSEIVPILRPWAAVSWFTCVLNDSIRVSPSAISTVSAESSSPNPALRRDLDFTRDSRCERRMSPCATVVPAPGGRRRCPQHTLRYFLGAQVSYATVCGRTYHRIPQSRYSKMPFQACRRILPIEGGKLAIDVGIIGPHGVRNLEE